MVDSKERKVQECDVMINNWYLYNEVTISSYNGIWYYFWSLSSRHLFWNSLFRGHWVDGEVSTGDWNWRARWLRWLLQQPWTSPTSGEQISRVLTIPIYWAGSITCIRTVNFRPVKNLTKLMIVVTKMCLIGDIDSLSSVPMMSLLLKRFLGRHTLYSFLKWRRLLNVIK